MTRHPLLALLGPAVLVVAVLTAFALRTTPAPDRDEPTAVDVGFLQDMIVHHHQAVTMAEIMRGGSDVEIIGLADVVRANQLQQIGQMTGYLQAWDKPLVASGDPMRWMLDLGHGRHSPPAGGAPMPGMATQAELNRLGELTGTTKDVFFLELMMRHHEGGVHMADAAVTLAATSQVRTLAQQITVEQAKENQRMAAFLGTRTP